MPEYVKWICLDCFSGCCVVSCSAYGKPKGCIYNLPNHIAKWQEEPLYYSEEELKQIKEQIERDKDSFERMAGNMMQAKEILQRWD